MGKHPYKMWVNVADFLAKTQHLSPVEFTAHVRVLFTMWLATDGTLPNSPRILARIAKIRECNWARTWEAIKDAFTVGDKTITNETLQQDLMEAKTKIVTAACSGSKGGQATQFRRGAETRFGVQKKGNATGP